MSNADFLRGLLRKTKDPRWGFVTYRCTYKDDREWNEFIDILSERARKELDAESSVDLLETMDWCVQEDHAYESASKARIREHFKDWIKDQSKTTSSPRYSLCLMADQDCVDSVLQAEKIPRQDRTSNGFVYLISSRFDPNATPDNEDDDDGLDEEVDEDEGDEDERDEIDEVDMGDILDPDEPLEGLTREYVGWIILDAVSVLPGAFVAMCSEKFDEFYERPPAVVRAM